MFKAIEVCYAVVDTISPRGPVFAALEKVVVDAGEPLKGWIGFGTLFHSGVVGGGSEPSVDLCIGVIEGNVTGSGGRRRWAPSVWGFDVGGIDGGGLWSRVG